MFKSAFFDIDGTLVSFRSHLVPPSTRRAIEELRRRGVKVFISSGRHVDSIDKLPGMVFDGFVLINGTLAMTCPPEGATAAQMSSPALAGRKVIYRKPIPQEDIHSWLDLLEREAHSTIMVSEEGLMINFLDEDMRGIMELLDFPMPEFGDLRQMRDKTICQLITTFRDEEEERIMQYLPHCKTTRWHPLFTDIINAEASKGLGVQAVLDYFGWQKEEVIAFGDGGNDLEMLDLAGTAVVMGNASDDVKAHADFVTDSVDNDGVANALRHYNLI
jgi:hypothetical protein